jgi:hypothetical protein
MSAVVTKVKEFCDRACSVLIKFQASSFLALLFFLASANLQAQEVHVRGGFFEDSLTVGDKVRFYLSVNYPRNLTVLFPDSTYNYLPFEYGGRNYFPTETREGISYDSVIYSLSTFEVDRVQRLALPVFLVNAQDCTLYRSETDSILLRQLVGKIDTISVEALPLKENVAYQDVPRMFNYPVLFFVLAVLLTLTAVIWFVFGKKIRRHFRIKRMLKVHQQFLDAFSKQVDTLKQAYTTPAAESALALWKRYMEQLERKPYTKLTTREIQRLEKDDVLTKNLNIIDGGIYGHPTSVVEPLESLKALARQRFSKKLEEIKHG